MASNWKTYLFDNDHAQRDDLELLRKNAELDASAVSKLRRKLRDTMARLDRAELVIEALFVTLEKQGLLKPESFETLMREIDDLDGKVDGKARVKPSEV